MVVHACNSSTWEDEAIEQESRLAYGLHSKTVSKKKKEKTKLSFTLCKLHFNNLDFKKKARTNLDVDWSCKQCFSEFELQLVYKDSSFKILAIGIPG
jgi:hypothetical protein